MLAVNTILEQIFILALLALIGVVAVRTKIIGDDARNVLEKIVFYITLPLLILTKISSLELTAEIIRNGIQLIVLTYVVLFLQIMIGKYSARILKLKPGQAVIHSLHMFLGNIVFLGFPLLDALFPGGEAILYAALYQLVMNTVLWTYGVNQLNPGREKGARINFKKFLNPNTIALVLAIGMLAMGFKLPRMLQIPLGGLGKTTLYLAMFYIGILLARTRLLQMMRKPDVFILSVQKLFLIPFLLIGLLYLLLEFSLIHLNATALSVLVLEASMPCMTILVLLAKRFGADDAKAMENFVVSTVFSILSLPLVLVLLRLLTG